MRPVTLLNLALVQDPIARNALIEVQRASQESDLVTIAQAFTITGTYTTTRSLNASTATLTDVINVLCTFIADCQKGGQVRTT